MAKRNEFGFRYATDPDRVAAAVDLYASEIRKFVTGNPLINPTSLKRPSEEGTTIGEHNLAVITALAVVQRELLTKYSKLVIGDSSDVNNEAA